MPILLQGDIERLNAASSGAVATGRIPCIQNDQLVTVTVNEIGTGAGAVDGPASSTDNAIARFDSTTGKLIQNSTVTVADTTGLQTFTAVGGTIAIKQGANGKTGTVTVNGTTPVVVSTTAFTANSGVLFTLKTVGGTVGQLPHLVTATPSTGFSVAATASDTSVYNWHIIESVA